MLDYLIAFSKEYADVFLGLTLFSALSVVLVMTLGARVLARLPSDYFLSPQDDKAYLQHFHPSIRVFVPFLKNITGVMLIIAGFVMLFIPGQGFLTILAGVILTDFPGKFRCELWLVRRPQVRRSINWLRRRSGQPELKLE